MPRKEFEAFTRLDASDVNTFLMDQTVMSFAGTAARGSAIPSPVEGMVTFLDDSDILSIYDGANWKTSLGAIGGVIQVVSETKTDTFTMASTTFEDVTGLSVSITPKSASNKILVSAHLIAVADSGVSNGAGRLMRDSTPIGVGDADGSRTRSSFGLDANGHADSVAVVTLDSPNTTSSVTYKVQIRRNNPSSGTMYVNRSESDGDSSAVERFVSSITVMEIAG
jgi:hypothetical protein